jgi:galactokinase
VAQAFNKAYDLRLTTRGVMEYAYRGERLTPSKCGRMDQACAYGRRPVVMKFEGELLHVEHLQLAKPLHFVLVDLKADKDTSIILSSLQAAYAPGADEVRRRHVSWRSQHLVRSPDAEHSHSCR